jgi:hypothetical protein
MAADFRPANETPGLLIGELKVVSELTTGERSRMRQLLDQYFQNVTESQFEADLGEKQWVVLLRDGRSYEIRGFSTLMILRASVHGQTVQALYSGDTIVDQQSWGTPELPKTWLRHVFSIATVLRGEQFYWMLICSGFRTYRFLQVFFRDFYPVYDRTTPRFEADVIHTFGSMKFGAQYDRSKGIVRFDAATPLRRGVGDITPERLKNPHVRFFVSRNADHRRGDELVCLARLDESNLTTVGRRMLRGA